MSAVSTTPATCQLTEHRFSASLFEQLVHFYILQLNDSFLNKNVNFTTLLGDTADLTANTIAQRLAKKTGKQAFVSCNLPSISQLLPLVESRLMTELENHPDKF
ncbi:proteasome assembly chaperone 4-like isoform X2 [Anneissia japonica]|uniref:proteasome assembly chaperone 4-like isoform X2 n=1 Tax=Anneissia japonica TaxID=1529436 RepID=UPI0014258C17|nr:proteasome assembly chaperone 4-like isoform X2 [Anneissia japonica]